MLTLFVLLSTPMMAQTAHYVVTYAGGITTTTGPNGIPWQRNYHPGDGGIGWSGGGSSHDVPVGGFSTATAWTRGSTPGTRVDV